MDSRQLGVLILGGVAYGVYKLTSGVQAGATEMSLYSVESLAAAIQTFEGYYPGTRAYRNNNPGNLKFAGQPGTTGQDDKGFAIFATFVDGWNALITLIRKRISQHPTWTILDFFMSYAPPSDNNDTTGYANFVAKTVGAPISATLGEFA